MIGRDALTVCARSTSYMRDLGSAYRSKCYTAEVATEDDERS